MADIFVSELVLVWGLLVMDKKHPKTFQPILLQYNYYTNKKLWYDGYLCSLDAHETTHLSASLSTIKSTCQFVTTLKTCDKCTNTSPTGSTVIPVYLTWCSLLELEWYCNYFKHFFQFDTVLMLKLVMQLKLL